MRKLWVYLKPYKKESILGPLFKLLEASFELTVPLVMAAMIDRGVAGRDRNVIFGYGGILILLGVIGLISSLTAQFFAAKAAVGFAAGLRESLFCKIQKMSFSVLDEIGTSTLMTRLTGDVNQIQNGLNLFLRLFLRSPFVVIGAMIMSFMVDVKSAWIFAIVIPVLFVIVIGIMLKSIPVYRKAQKVLSRMLMKVRENLSGVRVIRSVNGQEREMRDFDEEAKKLRILQLSAGRISAVLNPLTFVIVNGAVLCLLWSGALRVNSGNLTQGELIALVNYMSQILVELIKLASLIITLTKSLASAELVSGVLDAEEEDGILDGITIPTENPDDIKNPTEIPDIGETLKSTENQEPVLYFEKVSFTYHNAQEPALSEISFSAFKGQLIGIIGGTGSGKSTLIHLIPGFYPITKGVCKIFGTDTDHQNLRTLRNRISIAMQKPVLFSGTIRDNLKMGNQKATDEEMIQALKDAQAYDFLYNGKEGLETSVLPNGRNFSGGQRQRIGIARALVRKPDILILDDSASALDYATEAALRKSLSEYRRNGTLMLIVSQRTASVAHADQIIVLEDGNIVGIGTQKELLHSCSLYREIYESQYGAGSADREVTAG